MFFKLLLAIKLNYIVLTFCSYLFFDSPHIKNHIFPLKAYKEVIRATFSNDALRCVLDAFIKEVCQTFKFSTPTYAQPNLKGN